MQPGLVTNFEALQVHACLEGSNLRAGLELCQRCMAHLAQLSALPDASSKQQAVVLQLILLQVLQSKRRTQKEGSTSRPASESQVCYTYSLGSLLPTIFLCVSALLTAGFALGAVLQILDQRISGCISEADMHRDHCLAEHG